LSCSNEAEELGLLAVGDECRLTDEIAFGFQVDRPGEACVERRNRLVHVLP
jgi:hypothetical protein